MNSMPEWMALSDKVIAPTFNRQPVVWQRGQGCRLWDQSGREYLDFFSGHAVMNLGYGHPEQLRAMQEQMQRLVHTGNLFYLPAQAELAQLLVESSFGDRVFFANSGAEIVELAIKLVRKWGHAEGRFEVLTLKDSFHGRTFGALTATGQLKYHQGLEPMLPGFKHVARNDDIAMASAISNQTCAIMVEPVQGEGGIHPLEAEYLRKLRDLCDRNRLLLIFDEIQCGLGRTGRMYAYEHFNLQPDLLLLGKPLGGGLPLSALIIRDSLAEIMGRGGHGTTFGGNPVAAAGGCVLIRELQVPGFLERVQKVGAHLGKRLQDLAARFPERIAEVRGLGLMWGLELKRGGPEAVRLALQRGLVLNCTAGQVLRFLPALTVTPADVDQACDTVADVLNSLVPGEK